MARLTENKIKKLDAWLRACGCEILPLTNEYEVLRFKSPTGVGVIYHGKKGYSVNHTDTQHAINCFLKGKSWSGKVKPTKRINGSKLKKQAVDRDGCACFYCNEFLESKEMTLEHLVSINQGGKNSHSNTVIACYECNKKAGHLTLVEKIKLRDSIRKNNERI